VPPYQCQAGFHTNGLDVALVEWPMVKRADRQFGTANRQEVALGSRSQISQILPLHFLGARSGTRQIKVSNYSIRHSYRIGDDGPFVCVSDCLQVKLKDRPYVREDVSKGGDSGAWIIAEGSERPHWIGLLLGGDGDRSGIVPADRIMDYFQPELGLVRMLV
jgi:hypothetical protein